MRKFWTVWNPQGQNPSVKHDRFDLAISEAERLALRHSGHEFFVMESITVSKKLEVVTTRLEEGDYDDDLPF